MAKLLLHSLAVYSELIEQLAAVPDIPHVVEIGSESGAVSVRLAQAAAARGGELWVVEPSPSARLRRLAAEHPHVRVVEGFSPEALAAVPTAGLYVIDGDHNYATVRAELEAIYDRDDAEGSICVLHDVGWPSGRRDQYYAPERLDPASVHPHSFTRGAIPGQVQLAAEGRGFRGDGAFAFALREGGPRNGVLTAVEDVLAEDGDLSLLTTPLVFGLGVVGRRSSFAWKEVEELMQPYVDNPVLAQVERNRIELFARVLELQDTRRRARLGRLRDRVLRSAGVEGAR
jgi:hypothetical protein